MHFIYLVMFVFTLNPVYAETRFESSQAMEDSLLESKITVELTTEPFIDTLKFNISVFEQNVTLQGHIPSEVHRRIILQWMDKHEEVNHIYDELIVMDINENSLADPSPNQQEPVKAVQDALILADIRAKLFATRIIESKDIQVDVVEGTVYFQGAIPDEQQKTILITTTMYIPGVKEINDSQLLVKKIDEVQQPPVVLQSVI